jgi:hypothetical protein
MPVDFSKLNKIRQRSFNEQKALIKKVLNGRQVLCPHCQQPISFHPPETSEKPGIACAKGCSYVALDFE